MKMTLRWFYTADTIPLEYMKQVPGISGVVGALYDVPVGAVWKKDKIKPMMEKAKHAGLPIEVIESVNIHEDIKLGLPTREVYIDNYKQTIKNLADFGVKVICYNFMPIFDWTRSSLAYPLEDGSTVLSYERAVIEGVTPADMIKRMKNASGSYQMPGWEPERLADIEQLFRAYETVTETDLFQHLVYFLEAIMPTLKETGIKMAIHPDDPPWPVFGLPRILKDEQDIERLLEAVPEKENGVTFCTGSLGARQANDLLDIAEYCLKQDRMPFVHIRNITHTKDGDFHEVSHYDKSGSVDVVGLIKLLHTYQYDGYVRPDHGRMIWGEEARPGYGLYDRALGAMYMTGIWDSLEEGTTC